MIFIEILLILIILFLLRLIIFWVKFFFLNGDGIKKLFF